MKRFLLLASLLLSVGAQASTFDSKSFKFDGTQTREDFVLSAEKNHTEYRTEVVNKTCYRQELVGYYQQCETRYVNQCHIVRDCRIINGVRQCYDRQVCQAYPQNYCYQVPQYRTVAYTCQETISVPYTVKDYDVQANVRVEYGALPAGVRANEGFVLELSGDQVNLKAQKAKSNLLIFVEKEAHENLAGGLKTITVTYRVTFMNATDIVAPLNSEPSNFTLTNNENLTWDIKGLSHPELFSIHLTIEKVKILSGNPIIVDQLVVASQIPSKMIGGITRFETTLTDLGLASGQKESGKYKVKLTLRPTLDLSNLLNSSSLPEDLETKGEGTIKIN